MANTAPYALIDSHCHLDLSAFAHDFNAVVASAKSLGVTRFHIPGTTAKRWQPLTHLAARDDIDVSLGLHPYFLSEQPKSQLERSLDELDTQLDKHLPGVVAVGECGLDTVIDVDLQLQETIFARQLDLAKQHRYPLVLHARKSHHLIHQHLSAQRFAHGGVIHAFSGSVDVAKQYVDRNFVLGIGGTITYPRGYRTREAVKAVGLAHVVLETDSPDMPINGYQGQRNTPERLPLVMHTLAELFDIEPAEVARVTSANYLRLFH
ncbi:TatD family hydrolase [Alteromonas sp. ASW11-36]|uniref:TatD family hydrolase n=1 Tax=Alteromonas arenosi TaxID=3055817 RepID=A0ABT7SU93_9ALTE|nr:TatD family hydrolase [Alteromonas sp. ASW11-36]MDM7859763.1 TatD family hydrolase [Alteromonas sp. ASW11-36]